MKSTSHSRPCTRGFTLIEVMIVVAILGILAAIAIPQYTEYIRNARRADAQAVLMELAQEAERHYTRLNTYTGYTVSAATTSRASAFYQFTESIPSGGQSLLITATPTGAQTGDRCGALSINNLGVRAPATAGCWNR